MTSVNYAVLEILFFSILQYCRRSKFCSAIWNFVLQIHQPPYCNLINLIIPLLTIYISFVTHSITVIIYSLTLLFISVIPDTSLWRSYHSTISRQHVFHPPHTTGYYNQKYTDQFINVLVITSTHHPSTQHTNKGMTTMKKIIKHKFFNRENNSKTITGQPHQTYHWTENCTEFTSLDSN